MADSVQITVIIRVTILILSILGGIKNSKK